MAAALDVNKKQHAVIEFLCCENEAVAKIDKTYAKVYGDGTLYRKTIVWWQADCMVKVDMLKFRIFFAVADRILHNCPAC